MSKEKKNKERLPEWAPENAGSKFASRIVSGAKAPNEEMKVHSQANKHANTGPDLDKLESGVLASNRTILSKAITLIESNSPKHFNHAQELVRRLIPHSGNSVRIGITGVPGAGKSTFIETLGSWLIEQGHKVAVLAVDPSSTISKGSILGDKTRMEKLSRLDNSFIRPSPSSGVLGGVARKTRETIIACEAAGYDVILIETVGVGQSEVTVRSIVDFFLLLQITGAGDDLQGIKKGIMELADLIVINKADGDNIARAETTCNEIMQVLHYIQPVTEGWKTRAMTCSALTGHNIEQIWATVSDFVQVVKSNGTFEKRRSAQLLEWLNTMLVEALSNLFFNDYELVEQYGLAKQEIQSGMVSPAIAVSRLIELFKNRKAIS
jgi:LAO/AO transport system kinase